MAWTSDDLVAAVRRRAQLPDATADGAVTDADILAIADEEIALHLVPLVRSAREDYFVAYADQTITSGEALYRIPSRAQGTALRDVSIVDSSGNEYSIPRVSLEDAPGLERSGSTTVFVVEGNDVRLIPTPTSSSTLRVRYHRAHSILVPTSGTSWADVTTTGYATIDAADSLTQVQAPDLPASFVPDVGYEVDILHAYPPFGPFADDALITVVTDVGGGRNQLEFSGISEFRTGGTAGIVAAQNATSIVNLPRECWPLLVSLVTSRVLEVLGDRDAAQMAYALYERERDNVVTLLTPRVEGARKKIIAHWSPLRSRRRW